MAALRSPDLQLFLTAAEAAITGAASGPVRTVSERIFAALRTPSTQAGPNETERLPVCAHLPMAVELVRGQPGPVGRLAEAFASLEPRLEWQVRTGASQDPEFLNGHANATIIGADGLEVRHDVRIGVSLMAPNTRYPDHRHPPEEVYLVLSGGEWRQADGRWHAPGVGGLVHNPPNVVHAMRSTERPLLALWFLWTQAS